MSIKEEKKKVYVKPAITVAEWDFDKAVCDDNIMLLSTCNIHSERGQVEVQMNNFGGDLTWHDTPTTSRAQNERGF